MLNPPEILAMNRLAVELLHGVLDGQEECQEETLTFMLLNCAFAADEEFLRWCFPPDGEQQQPPETLPATNNGPSQLILQPSPTGQPLSQRILDSTLEDSVVMYRRAILLSPTPSFSATLTSAIYNPSSSSPTSVQSYPPNANDQGTITRNGQQPAISREWKLAYAAIMYNTGLAFHSYALRHYHPPKGGLNGFFRTAHLEQAMNLYLLALSIVKTPLLNNMGDTYHPHHFEVCQWLQLAVCNNMAHIAWTTKNATTVLDSNYWLNQLCNLLQQVSEPSLVEIEDFSLFLSNLILLQGSHLWLAPAA